MDQKIALLPNVGEQIGKFYAYLTALCDRKTVEN